MVVICLLALLPILAALQYHWIGQLSNSEVDRLRTNLQTSVDNFGHAINHELFPAQFAFRVSFTGSLDQIARELSLNYQYWASRVSRPDLIENIYWVDYDENRHLQLYLFEPAEGILVNKPWPDDLLGWKNYFIERNRHQLEQYNPGEADPASSEEFLKKNAQLLAERPAIPIAVSIDSELAPEELLANLNATSSGRAGHTLLTLDVAYLKNTFFPNLQEEFFHTSDNIDLIIHSNSEPENVIFKSDPSLSLELFEQPDAEAHIARFRWNRFTSASRLAFAYASLIDRDQIAADSIIEQVQRAWQPALRDSFILEPQELMSDFPLQAVIRLAQEDNYEGELTAEDLLVALTNLTSASTPPNEGRTNEGRTNEGRTNEGRTGKTEQQNAGTSNSTASTGSQANMTTSTEVTNTSLAYPEYAWTLKIRHKTGSLEASVGANRRRNLMMSFGILLILGIASSLVFISSRRAQQLADRQMSFVTGVSHELRTPLAVIKSAADNLADGVISEPGRMQKYGQLIRKESARLADMVEQILELAGALSQNKKITLEPNDIDTLISEALDVCKESIAEEDFQVQVTLAENLPPVTGDARSLQIAISNLISNAIKYSNGNRWIAIETSLWKNGKGPEVQIRVTDKGVGIPAEDLPFIFEDFYRGPAVRKAQIKGTGIGLSIVKKTMEAHGGRVTVQSGEPLGTTFTLHLPVKT